MKPKSNLSKTSLSASAYEHCFLKRFPDFSNFDHFKVKIFTDVYDLKIVLEKMLLLLQFAFNDLFDTKEGYPLG